MVTAGEEEGEESQPRCYVLVVMETDMLNFITRLLFSRYDVAVEIQPKASKNIKEKKLPRTF
jgi:hypothetical protein